jgi:hypothetical protein
MAFFAQVPSPQSTKPRGHPPWQVCVDWLQVCTLKHPLPHS